MLRAEDAVKKAEKTLDELREAARRCGQRISTRQTPRP